MKNRFNVEEFFSVHHHDKAISEVRDHSRRPPSNRNRRSKYSSSRRTSKDMNSPPVFYPASYVDIKPIKSFYLSGYANKFIYCDVEKKILDYFSFLEEEVSDIYRLPKFTETHRESLDPDIFGWSSYQNQYSTIEDSGVAGEVKRIKDSCNENDTPICEWRVYADTDGNNIEILFFIFDANTIFDLLYFQTGTNFPLDFLVADYYFGAHFSFGNPIFTLMKAKRKYPQYILSGSFPEEDKALLEGWKIQDRNLYGRNLYTRAESQDIIYYFCREYLRKEGLTFSRIAHLVQTIENNDFYSFQELYSALKQELCSFDRNFTSALLEKYGPRRGAYFYSVLRPHIDTKQMPLLPELELYGDEIINEAANFEPVYSYFNPEYVVDKTPIVLQSIFSGLTEETSIFVHIRDFDIALLLDGLSKYFPHIKRLKIGYNKQSEPIPSNIGGLKYLEKLTLQYTLYKSFPKELALLRYLKNITFRMHRSSDFMIPEGVLEQMSSLESIHFNDPRKNTQYNFLPKWYQIKQERDDNWLRQQLCSGDKKLNLSAKNISNIPQDIELSHIEELDISNNPISDVPNLLSRLSNVRRLNLSGCDFYRFDEHMCQNMPIEQLIWKKTNSSSQDGFSMEDIENMTVRILHSNNNLEIVLDTKEQNILNLNILLLASDEQCSLVEFLDLSDNLYERFSSLIRRCLNIHKLDVSGNSSLNLKELVENLALHKSLHIPHDVSIDSQYQKELEILLLLYGSVEQKQQVTSLDLSDGLLQKYTVLLQNCPNITHLKISNNNLTHCPEDVFALTQLQVLDLSDNDLIELSQKICHVETLNKIYLNNNPSLQGDVFKNVFYHLFQKNIQIIIEDQELLAFDYVSQDITVDVQLSEEVQLYQDWINKTDQLFIKEIIQKTLANCDFTEVVEENCEGDIKSSFVNNRYAMKKRLLHCLLTYRFNRETADTVQNHLNHLFNKGPYPLDININTRLPTMICSSKVKFLSFRMMLLGLQKVCSIEGTVVRAFQDIHGYRRIHDLDEVVSKNGIFWYGTKRFIQIIFR